MDKPKTCATCKHCNEWEEPHPEVHASEFMSECGHPDLPEDWDDDNGIDEAHPCPLWEERPRDYAQELQDAQMEIAHFEQELEDTREKLAVFQGHYERAMLIVKKHTEIRKRIDRICGVTPQERQDIIGEAAVESALTLIELRYVELKTVIAAALIAAVGDDNLKCSYDHHGQCQAHNLQPKGECWVEKACQLLGIKQE